MVPHGAMYVQDRFRHLPPPLLRPPLMLDSQNKGPASATHLAETDRRESHEQPQALPADPDHDPGVMRFAPSQPPQTRADVSIALMPRESDPLGLL